MDDVRFRLRVFLALMLGVMVLGTLGFMWAERLSLANALYFSVVTVTTVGYGDIHPVSTVGKVLAVLLILGGVGTFMGVVANATEMLLSRRERAVRLQRLAIVEGTFFSEVGTHLLAQMVEADPQQEDLAGCLRIGQDWDAREFDKLASELKQHDFQVELDRLDLDDLRRYLQEKSHFLLRILENPNLVESAGFTECLRAVFHLKDELYHRRGLKSLPPKDQAHLAGDARRAYLLLVGQWLEYVRHLSHNHPYLFSLAIRLNPFDPGRSAVLE